MFTKRNPIEALESELATLTERAENLRQKSEKARAENEEAVSARRASLDADDFDDQRLADADRRVAETQRARAAFTEACDVADSKIASAQQGLDAARDGVQRETLAKQILAGVKAAEGEGTKLNEALDALTVSIQGYGVAGWKAAELAQQFKVQIANYVPFAIEFAREYAAGILDGTKSPSNVRLETSRTEGKSVA